MEDGFLYQRLVKRVLTLIETDTLASGDKAPSIRRLSQTLKVSASTVVKAYSELERIGFLESRPQSGFYVRRPVSVEAPRAASADLVPKKVTVSQLTRLVYEHADRDGIAPLGMAIPSPELLPTRKLGTLVSSVARHCASAAVQYSFPPGNPELRKQISLRTLRWDHALSASDLLITNGAIEAVSLSLRAVTQPGDIVAIQSPTYFGTLQLLEDLGLLAVEIPTDPVDGIDFRALEKALATRRLAACLFTTSFNNPDGTLIPDEKKKQLVERLRRSGVPLIEDDVYGDLGFGSLRPKTAKSYDRFGDVLLCGSFSKSLAPGFRIGWVSGGKYHDRITRLKFTSTIAAPTIQQIALARYLSSGAYDRHVKGMRRQTEATVARTRLVASRHFPPGTKIAEPRGGLTLWIELPESIDSAELYTTALKEGIVITPGVLFSPTAKYRSFIRLNCAYRWSEPIGQTLARLGRITTQLLKLKPRRTEG